MSKLCDQVVAVLRSIFPHMTVRTEEYVDYRGQRLFLDIWMPQLNLIVEVHGRQHEQFVEHFHGSVEVFKAARKRDSLKEEWADLQEYTMVVLREDELPIAPERLLDIIEEKQSG